MSRLRADLHEGWSDKSSKETKQFRRLLARTPPDELMHLIDNVGHEALRDECKKKGIPVEDVSHYWYKGKHFSIFSKSKAEPTYQELRDEIIAEMSEYAPVYPVLERKPHVDPHLLVIDPADVHIGKLASKTETGEEYNSKIAVERALEGVSGLLSRVDVYGINKIVFVAGNDILHIDTPRRTTTSGTPQDTDGMWYDNFKTAKDLYIKLIEMCCQVADVEVIYCPSNHDFMSGFMLTDSVLSWFSKNEQVTFQASMSHRKYTRYGENLLGFSHGDGAKEKDLPLLMAHEAGHDWVVKHKYIYTHHVHHKTAKDYMGVCVESLRSPSGTDSWHHRQGYQHAPKAVEGFVHHPSYGQVARLVYKF